MHSLLVLSKLEKLENLEIGERRGEKGLNGPPGRRLMVAGADSGGESNKFWNNQFRKK